jgi:hypothetical protein
MFRASGIDREPRGRMSWCRPAYRASQADGEAWQSALRPKRCLLSINLKLRNILGSKLMLDWSPKQISGWLKPQYPDDESMRVSHETIYRSLFIQARGALKKELLAHLRSKRRIRRSQHSRIFKDGRGQIPEAISIRERPAEVEDRAIPGHWEGDLLRGSGNSHIATLVERHSRFVLLIKVPSRDTAEVVGALSKHVRKLPTFIRTMMFSLAVAGALAVSAVHAQTPPKMKMTTDIPPSITTPDSVETPIGTLKFFDGFPDDATVQKAYDNLDFMHAVEAFLNAMPGASVEVVRLGFASQGADNNQTVLIMENQMDSKSLFLTPHTERGTRILLWRK